MISLPHNIRGTVLSYDSDPTTSAGLEVHGVIPKGLAQGIKHSRVDLLGLAEKQTGPEVPTTRRIARHRRRRNESRNHECSQGSGLMSARNTHTHTRTHATSDDRPQWKGHSSTMKASFSKSCVDHIVSMDRWG